MNYFIFPQELIGPIHKAPNFGREVLSCWIDDVYWSRLKVPAWQDGDKLASTNISLHGERRSRANACSSKTCCDGNVWVFELH